jgi:hypothetical protein
VAVVQLGIVDGDLVQILSGLGTDAVVATDHLQDLYDSETVQVNLQGSPATPATGAK